MGIETIEKYLISLGYEVDASAYRKFEASLKKAENVVEKHTSFLSSSFVKASGAVVGAMGTVAISTGTLLDSLAKADLGYEKLALRMYMSKDAAKQYSLVLKAMGEKPEDIAWIPMLQRQYRELMEDTKKLELPASYSEGLDGIHEIQHQFHRLKLESIYGLQWIGESILRNLKNPLDKTKFGFKDLNDYIIHNIPSWSDKIGSVLSDLIKIFGDVWDISKLAGEGIVGFWDSLSPTTKGIVGISILTGLFLASGPFGKFLIVIPAIIALMSEFWAAMEGKETTIPIELLQGIAGAFDLIARSLLTIKALGEATKDFLSIPAKVADVMYKGAVTGYKNIPKTFGFGESEWEKVERQGAERSFQLSLNNLKNTWRKGKDYPQQISDAWDITKNPSVLGFLAQKYPKFFFSDEQRKNQTRIEQEKFLKGKGIDQKTIDEILKGNLEALDLYYNQKENLGFPQKKLSKQVESYRNLAEKYFGAESELFLRIMQAESGGFENKAPLNTKGKYAGTRDYGLFQINSMHEKELRKEGILKSGEGMSALFDPERNFMAAKWLYGKQGLKAWKASVGNWGGAQFLSGKSSIGNMPISSISNSGNMNVNIYVQGDKKDEAFAEKIANKINEMKKNNIFNGVALMSSGPSPARGT